MARAWRDGGRIHTETVPRGCIAAHYPEDACRLLRLADIVPAATR